MTAIEVEGLHKAYGEHEAVRGIDFKVERGEVFGLLGPNGAGKTTTVEILEGYRKRTSGRVSVLGHDPADRDPDLRSRVGIVLQTSGFYSHLTVREAVHHWAGFYPAPRDPEEVIVLAGLAEAADRRARTLSGGQHRRLDLARSSSKARRALWGPARRATA
jgi:ABC-2 type transport system ATP-binding protein